MSLFGVVIDVVDARGRGQAHLPPYRGLTHRGMKWMSDNDITGVIEETFSLQEEHFGDIVTIELKVEWTSRSQRRTNKSLSI